MNASTRFQLPLALDDARLACRDAIIGLGWGVDSIETSRIVTRRGGWDFTRDPARLEIELAEAGPERTEVVVNERTPGFGHFAEQHIASEIARVRAAIDAAADRQQPVG